jgi:lysophospholipase L1-like esterase
MNVASPSPPAARAGWARRALGATLVVVAAVVVGLGLVEGMVRLFLPAFDPSGRIELSHRVGSLPLGPPGSVGRQVKNTGDYDVAVAINRHGLRDARDVAQARRDDLLVIGDSFAWGWGVEAADRFSDLLEGMTGRRVFNVATPTDLDGYAALLDYARALGADVGDVVVAVCMENDLDLYDAEASADAERPPAPAPAAGGGALVAWLRDEAGDWKLWLTERSAAYVFLTTVVHQVPWLKAAAIRVGAIVPHLEGIGSSPYSAAVIESSAAKLEALSKQARLLVVLVPSRALWVGNDRVDEERVHEAFAAALVRRGVSVLDLRPKFEAGGQPLAYHFANDGHWNPLGHRLAAEEIARCLATRSGTRPLDCR